MSVGLTAAPEQPVHMGQFWMSYNLYRNERAIMLEPVTHSALGCGPARCVARLEFPMWLKRQWFLDERYSFPPPPVPHAAWTADDWVRYIDNCGRWLPYPP